MRINLSCVCIIKKKNHRMLYKILPQGSLVCLRLFNYNLLFSKSLNEENKFIQLHMFNWLKCISPLFKL